MAVSRGGAATAAGECFGRVSAPGRHGRIDTRQHRLTSAQISRMLRRPLGYAGAAHVSDIGCHSR